jgi:hypothetical protein
MLSLAFLNLAQEVEINQLRTELAHLHEIIKRKSLE